MKKLVLKTIYIAIVFVVALVLFGRIVGSDESTDSDVMDSPRLPLIRLMLRDGSEAMTLRGYKGNMDIRSMRGGLFPVSPDRGVMLRLETYGENVGELYYEIRDIAGGDLIEKTDMELSWNDSRDMAGARITLKDLVDAETEYMLVIVANVGGVPVNYYSRVIVTSSGTVDFASEAVEFARVFSEKTFDGGDRDFIVPYLESDRSGDNTTFARVNIHSSFSQVAWGELPIVAHDKPRASLGDIRGDIVTVNVENKVMMKSDADPDRHLEYDVRETFRLRQGRDRIYLLGYDRYCNYRFPGSAEDFGSDMIELGIGDENVPFLENEDGSVFAFASGDKVFCFKKDTGELIVLFGFEDGENTDERSVYNGHKYHILNVDDKGNVSFIVYGYMNRGIHEGLVGVALFDYDASIKEVSEKNFLPVDVSPEILMAQVDRMSYAGGDGKLYLMLGDDVVCMDPEEGQLRGLVEDAAKAVSFRSVSGELFAWSTDDGINLLKLDSGDASRIDPDPGTMLIPLGFMQEDLVYGVVAREDIKKDQAGNEVYAMSSVKIRDVAGNILENYTSEGRFVVSAEIDDMIIRLDRVTYNETTGFYEESEKDQIVNTLESRERVNRVLTATSDIWERIVEINYGKDYDHSAIRVVRPTLFLPDPENGGETAGMDEGICRISGFYVYSNSGSVEQICADEADAVTFADDLGSVVTDASGRTVWERRSMLARNQIMSVTSSAQNAEFDTDSSAARCMSLVLEQRGINRDVTELMNDGFSLSEILEMSLSGCRALTLTGCDAAAMLYYVNMDIPVLVSMKDGSAMLFIGFNDSEFVVVDPMREKNERVYKITRSQGTRMFAENGNRFLAYYSGSPAV
ncbi:MAG: hypothetical protein K6C95_05800 [Lachnospiraceae bacterium]|nr:hypothetical protein [Lachnospiraceae bacterium]